VQVGLDQDPPIYAARTAEMTGMSHQAQLLLIEIQSCELFVLGLAWNRDPPILYLSTGFISMSHCSWLHIHFLPGIAIFEILLQFSIHMSIPS
jgi:hypothetical protein